MALRVPLTLVFVVDVSYKFLLLFMTTGANCTTTCIGYHKFNDSKLLTWMAPLGFLKFAETGQVYSSS